MIEQYVFDKISDDETLQGLLSAGSDGLHLYPAVVPRGINFDRAVTFTLITTFDAYPNVNSCNVQFTIFAKTHTDAAEIGKALAAVFNEDNHQSDNNGDINVIFSIRKSESDLGFDFDGDGLYQREATYYFKIR